ncbi:MAG: adenylate kinase [Clostridiaceae bacterium]|nr:adenylate kinase [Clostridiaceae bacterium]
MRLMIIGAPGAGKGTQAAILSKKLGIPHISTGDIFRINIKNETPLGQLAKQYIDNGALVPDEVTIGIVKGRLTEPDCGNGFILDGFPRTIPQAESLDSMLREMDQKLDKVLNIVVDDDVIIRRLTGRRVCPECNAIYHISTSEKAREGVCESCSAKLIQREDDREETVINRLKTYHIQTEPLISYYKGKGILSEVHGQCLVEDTTAEVNKELGLKE